MLAGRELDPVTALAAMANIDALAAKLRNANWAGSLQHLRAQVMTELLQGRNPLDRLTAGRDLEPASPAPESSEGPVTGSPEGNGGPGSRPAEGSANPADEDWQDDPGYRDEERDEELATPPRRGDVSDPGEVTAEPAPLPALINILVPAGTLLGWSATPAQVGSWGLLDADGTKAFVQAASLSPRTRFCLTLVAPDGTALAHGCARGQHPWTPSASAAPRSGDPPGQSSPPGPMPGSRGDPSPSPAQAQRLADLIRRLNVTFRPILHGRCDHTDAEDHYSPSRVLKHLVRARTATCTAPACNAQAVFCDLDHTVPYPDGPSCQCNLAPKCRRHHRCKQATGWKVEQPEPGTFRWTVPSGRTYTTTPTVYDL
jgi:hypothetical protein